MAAVVSPKGKRKTPVPVPTLGQDEAVEVRKSWISTIRPYRLESMNKYSRYDSSTGEVVDVTKGFDANLKLDEFYTSVDAVVPGFKITLLPHQCMTVRTMIDLERVKYIKTTISLKVTCFASDTAVIETCAGVLSDKLGSGKTFCILAVIELTKTMNMPKVANITDLEFPQREKAMRAHAFRTRETYDHIGWKTEVRRIYKKLIPVSLVFVSKSVLFQWEKAITECTTLKVFRIENIFNLKAFYEMVFAPNAKNNMKKLQEYDIILIKNGDISGKFEPPELVGSGMDGVKKKAILSVFGELFKDYCFSRVVLDDFDTLGIPNTAFTIPAMFTWFVSATKKLFNGGTHAYPAKDIKDALACSRPAYVQAWKNRTLFTFFNISCTDEFTDRSTQAAQVEFYTYKFVNPNEQYIGLLGAMGTADAHIVMEALNGDAIQTAAGTVGLKSTSVADIFEKVLDDKWTIYKKNLEVERYLVGVKQWAEELPPPGLKDTPYGSTALTKVTRNLKKPGPMSDLRSLIHYVDEGVTGTIAEVRTENNTSKETHGKAINRVRDNLKQGDCPILGTPLKDQNVVIVKCCGITISAEAASFSLKLKKTGTNSGDIAGSCPNCRRNIMFSQLIVIDRELNLDDIINENVEVSPPLPSEMEAEENPSDKPVEEEEFNKYSCIVRIIQGTDQTDAEIRKIKEKRSINIPSMLVGQYNKGIAPAGDRKVLVYASYGETLDHLTKRLITKGIPYLRLQGTAHQIDDMVRRYNLPNSNPESIAVLLINGARYCAGLNLQVTTDLIFTHKIVDQNVESQVAARASRFGRTYNLRIHYVLYDNEIHFMFASRPSVSR